MKKLFFIGLLFVLALTSCQTELKLAKNFVAEQSNTRVAVYFPEKADVKVEYNTQYQMQTEVLQGFSQDLFLDVLYGAYADELRAYGLDVYVPENADNVQVDCYKHPLNTVNVASWFEINDGEWKPVQFCEHNLIDGFDSKTDFSFWTTKFDYTYTIDTLQLEDVYNYAVYLGKLYAGYTYDYMMNSYVGEELKKRNYAYQLLLRYDPFYKKLRYAGENDGFISLDNP